MAIYGAQSKEAEQHVDKKTEEITIRQWILYNDPTDKGY